MKITSKFLVGKKKKAYTCKAVKLPPCLQDSTKGRTKATTCDITAGAFLQTDQPSTTSKDDKVCNYQIYRANTAGGPCLSGPNQPENIQGQDTVCSHGEVQRCSCMQR